MSDPVNLQDMALRRLEECLRSARSIWSGVQLYSPEEINKILEKYKEGYSPSTFGKNEDSQMGGMKMNDQELRQYCLELAVMRDIELAKLKITTNTPLETARAYYAWINSATSCETSKDRDDTP